MNNFEKFEEELPRTGNFCSSLTGKKINGLEQIWNESDERLSRFVFRMWRFTVRFYVLLFLKDLEIIA